MYYDYYSNELYHHGILGQKWGVRRYQNEDGSLTPAGQKRYGNYTTGSQYEKRLNDIDKAIAYNKRDLRDSKKLKSDLDFKAIKRGNLRVDMHGNKSYRFSDSKRDQDLKKQIDDMDELIKKYDRNIQAGKAETEVLLKNLKSKGFNYSSEDTTRFTNRGKDYVKGTVTTLASVPVMSFIGNPFGMGAVVAVPLHREKGTKYNVK